MDLTAWLATASDWLTGPATWMVACVIAGTAVTSYVFRRVFDNLEVRAARTLTVWDDAFLKAVRKPMRLLVWLGGISIAVDVVAAQSHTDLSDAISMVRFFMLLLVVTLFSLRFIAALEDAFVHSGSDVTTVHAIGKLLRVMVSIVALLTLLQNLGVSLGGILAFGGIGGIAVGFAARDLLANFFGGLMIYLDRPFSVGDWIRSPDRNIEGTVETIGWRLTMIRTFDQRPLYVPNSVFASIAVENPQRMWNRRIFETIGLRYDDATKVRPIVDDVRQMLLDHAEIDDRRTLIVNFDAFAPSSLDFFIYTFTRTSEWIEFHNVKQDVLLKVLDIIDAHGAEVAFPTSTLRFAHVES
jgi:MscS family membrane protein